MPFVYTTFGIVITLINVFIEVFNPLGWEIIEVYLFLPLALIISGLPRNRNPTPSGGVQHNRSNQTLTTGIMLLLKAQNNSKGVRNIHFGPISLLQNL
jgi:hypothetical protein